jgi:uncharacterized protein DUF4386
MFPVKAITGGIARPSMSTEESMKGSVQPNPRLIGVVYLSYFLIATLGDFIIKRVVIAGDPAATAARLLAHEATYRTGFAIYMVGNMAYVALTALFYRLLEPVNRTIALLMAFFSLVGCITQIVAGLLELAPLSLLRDAHMTSAFQAEQLRAVALMSLKIYSQAFTISFVQFGLFDFMLGVLIFQSTFMPRILGVLMMVAGTVAMTFLYAPFALANRWVVIPVAGLPEVALMLWLIVKGVNVARWKERVAPPVAAPA